MRKINFLFIVIGFWLASCSPKVTTQIAKSFTPVDFKQEIVVYGLADAVPSQSDEIGLVRIGDTGFTTNCGFETVVDLAKLEARKAGGNAIKIIDHQPPAAFGSTCHQIVAKILKVHDFNSIAKMSAADSALANADYAVLHFYRFSGPGMIISYDVHLGDTVLCRAKNNWRKTVRVKKDGLNSLWARTEVKEEIPINIKLGKEYYIRCGISTGAFVGHPKLDLVSNDLGRIEYPAVMLKKNGLNDRLVLNDGRELECSVLRQDGENVYFRCEKNGNAVETLVKKSDVKEIIIEK